MFPAASGPFGGHFGGQIFPGNSIGPQLGATRRERTRDDAADRCCNQKRQAPAYATDEMTAHGFRAMASTLLNESGKWHPDAIERALAHGDSDKVRAAYHRGAHWKERVAMAQWWSDYLDQLRAGAQILHPEFVKAVS